MILQASTLSKNQTGYILQLLSRISLSILLTFVSKSPRKEKRKRGSFADISIDTLLILFLTFEQNCYHKIIGVAIIVGCFN